MPQALSQAPGMNLARTCKNPREPYSGTVTGFRRCTTTRWGLQSWMRRDAQSWMSGVRTVNSGLRCRHDHFTNCIAASCHDVLVIMRYPIFKSLLISYSDFIHHLLLVYHASQVFPFPSKSTWDLASSAGLLAWVITILLQSSNTACYNSFITVGSFCLQQVSCSLNGRPIPPAPTSSNPSNTPSIPHTAAAAYSTHQT